MKKQYLLMALLVVMGMGLSTAVFAEETALDNTNSNSSVNEQNSGGKPPIFIQKRKELRKDIMEEREIGRKEIKTMREDDKEEVKNIRENNKSEMDKLRAELTAKVNSGEITKEEAYKIFNEQSKIEKESNKKEIRDLKKENKKEITDKKESLKQEIKKKQEALKNEVQQKFEVRFDAMINRFKTLSQRIDSRIQKLEADGKDMTASKTALAEANTMISDLESKIKNTTLTQGTDDASKEANKKAVDEIKASMKQIQDKLGSITPLLK